MNANDKFLSSYGSYRQEFKYNWTHLLDFLLLPGEGILVSIGTAVLMLVTRLQI